MIINNKKHFNDFRNKSVIFREAIKKTYPSYTCGDFTLIDFVALLNVLHGFASDSHLYDDTNEFYKEKYLEFLNTVQSMVDYDLSQIQEASLDYEELQND